MAALKRRWLMIFVQFSFVICSNYGNPVDEKSYDRIKAEIIPIHPVVAEGQNLTLNCTITEEGNFENISSEMLYFTLDGDDARLIALDDDTRVVDRKTIQLSLKDVQLNMTSRNISCHLRRGDGDVVKLDEVLLVVRELPQIKQCRVLNWEELHCTWDLPNADVNITLGYSRTGGGTDGRDWFACPHLRNKTCSWYSDSNNLDQFFEATYTVVLYRDNDSKELLLDSLKSYDSKNIVEPNPVSNIKSQVINSHVAFISWTSPATSTTGNKKELNYRVAYRSQYSSDVKVFNTTNTSIELFDLTPYTRYKVTIDCKPIVNDNTTGFWSRESESKEFRTDEDVPAMLPRVSSGAFLFSDGNVTNQVVRLFFKTAPDRFRNGNSSYNVTSSRRNRYTELSSVSKMTSMTDVSLDLERNSDYDVTVDARTSVGYNDSLKPIRVIIARQGTRPSIPEDFVVLSDDDQHLYLFSWTAVTNVTSYTLYWCNGTSSMTGHHFQCLNELDWKILPSSTTSAELILPHSSDASLLLFAVSAEMLMPSGDVISSGMQTRQCAYSRNTALNPPDKFHFISPSQPNSLEVRWTSSADERSCRRGYISHYIVSYCQRSNCADTNKTIKVKSSQNQVTISQLIENEIYQVQIKSWSYLTESKYTAPLQDSARASVSGRLSNGLIVVILIVVISIIVFVLVIIYRIYRYCWKKLFGIVITPPIYRAPETKNENCTSHYSYDCAVQPKDTVVIYENNQMRSKTIVNRPSETRSLLSESDSGCDERSSLASSSKSTPTCVVGPSDVDVFAACASHSTDRMATSARAVEEASSSVSGYDVIRCNVDAGNVLFTTPASCFLRENDAT